MANLLARKVGAELIGTFGLVVAGCGAIIVSQTQPGALSSIGVALAFGIVITVMVAATGHISGGHLNPAVSVGLAATGRLSWKDLPFYLLAQFVGAILGALLLLWIFGSQALVELTVNAPAGHVSAWQAVGVEAVITAFLVFVISAVATDTQSIGRLAAFAIGAAILLGALWGGPLTGASMNPARSLGPVLIAGDWDNLRSTYWIYLVGPIVGGIIGAALYHLIRQPTSAQAENTATAEVPVTSKTQPTTLKVSANAPRLSANNNRKQKTGARR